MSADDNDRVSRRRFLQALGMAGVVGASGSLLAACGGGDSGNGESGSGATSGSKTASADCTDISMLSDAQKKQRSQMVESLQYVEETPNSEQNCANCQLYQKGKYDGCGGCQLFPGPVTENGYCNSWAPAS
mgnify:CR=1 FL=1